MKARTMWAGIEFQPNLTQPRKPVRLGILSLTTSGDGVLLGRQPILDNKPPEFQDVSSMSLELAANWIDSMWKDILEADKDNVFNRLNRLNERWRWNLYVRPIRVGTNTSQGDLLNIAKHVYERFVGEPFTIPTRRRVPITAHRRRQNALTPLLPAAWLVSEIMKRSSSHSVAVS